MAADCLCCVFVGQFFAVSVLEHLID